MPVIDAGISAATGGTCLGTAGVLYVADRLPWINRFAAKIKSPQIQVLLVFTASLGLISTPLINRATTGIGGLLESTVGRYTGVGIMSAVAIAALLMLVSDFMSGLKGGGGSKAGGKKHASASGGGMKPRTLLLAAFTPPLAVMIPGVIGAAAATVLGFVATQVGLLAMWLMGG